ncbi:hypothetical protein P4S65_06375 [Pseudoalteromonas sp. B131b]|uniref:hypothetical protein n=1 Tax=Pseudoalteromonas TaxID=53246 RepID=UPI000BBE1B22|nr:hypothetical protein [Pseudoalteromonas sp. 1_2015MBL_MicDiv]ATG76398.1 hypothetical protein AOR04_01925 [Pseudoalteromonas sp. 1_2015MBL_MicDiv]
MRAFKTGILIASALLFIGAFSFSPNSEPEISSVNNCHYQNLSVVSKNTAEVCIKIEEDSSWVSWITGDSRSAQFHYLDLLELLTSSDDSKKAPSLKPLF